MAADTVADTRSRLLDTALKLFSEHGTEATSLQMIANELGVTKAAVYYHFKTKDEIFEAVSTPLLQEVERFLDEALTKRGRGAQVDCALEGFVDTILRHRTLIGVITGDPALRRFIDRKMASPSGKGLQTLKLVLTGPTPGLADIIAVNVMLAGLAMAGDVPELVAVDDDALRQHLVEIGRRVLGRRRPSARAREKRHRDGS